MNALAQMVERGEMFAPVVIQRLQHHAAFELAHVFFVLDQSEFFFVLARSIFQDARFDFLLVEGGLLFDPIRDRHFDVEFAQQGLFQARRIPLFFHAFRRNINGRFGAEHVVAHRRDGLGDVSRFE